MLRSHIQVRAPWSWRRAARLAQVLLVPEHLLGGFEAICGPECVERVAG